MYITGNLQDGSVSGTPITAVDIDGNGSTIYITYLDGDSNLKMVAVDRSTSAAMTGCTIVQ